MAIVTTGLAAEYVGKLAKNGTLPGNNADPTSTWDNVIGGNDLTASAGFAWTTSSGWRGDGSSGDPYCVQFDGTDTYFRETTSGLVDGDGSWTIEAWALFVEAHASDEKLLTGFSTTDNDTGLIFGFDGTSDVMTYTHYVDSGAYSAHAGAADVADGTTFHHVVVVKDSTPAIRIYADGSATGVPSAPQCGGADQCGVRRRLPHLGDHLRAVQHGARRHGAPLHRRVIRCRGPAELQLGYPRGQYRRSPRGGFSGLIVTASCRGKPWLSLSQPQPSPPRRRTRRRMRRRLSPRRVMTSSSSSSSPRRRPLRGGLTGSGTPSTFSQICHAHKAGGADTLYCFVANQLSNGSADTLTFSCSGDAATGVIIMPIRVAGGPSGRLGANAVRQYNVVDSQAGADHPKPSFSYNAQTGNGCHRLRRLCDQPARHHAADKLVRTHRLKPEPVRLRSARRPVTTSRSPPRT